MASDDSCRFYPPVAPAVIAEAEDKLGFKLPDLLRDIYTKVANGGFGPGYGIIGIEGGMLDEGRSIVDTYLLFRGESTSDRYWKWPEGLLPICHWGCNILSCLGCKTPSVPVIVFDPNLHTHRRWDDAFIYQRQTFQQWFEAWLDGVNLSKYMTKDLKLDKRLLQLIGQGKIISAMLLYQKEKLCTLKEAELYIKSLKQRM